MQEATIVAKIPSVRAKTQDIRLGLESQAIVLDVTSETARADFNRLVEEVTALIKLMEDKSEQDRVISLKVTELKKTVATARADLGCLVEEVTALTKLIKYKSEQVDSIRGNSVQMMANMQANFVCGSSA